MHLLHKWTWRPALQTWQRVFHGWVKISKLENLFRPSAPYLRTFKRQIKVLTRSNPSIKRKGNTWGLKRLQEWDTKAKSKMQKQKAKSRLNSRGSQYRKITNTSAFAALAHDLTLTQPIDLSSVFSGQNKPGQIHKYTHTQMHKYTNTQKYIHYTNRDKPLFCHQCGKTILEKSRGFVEMVCSSKCQAQNYHALILSNIL